MRHSILNHLYLALPFILQNEETYLFECRLWLSKICQCIPVETLLCFKERCGSKCKQAVDLPVIVSDCMIFLSLFLAIKRMSISTVSFFAARLWNYLPLEYFLLAYGLSTWMSRVNRHLLPFSLYIIISTMCFLYLFCLILFFILKNECCT